MRFSWLTVLAALAGFWLLAGVAAPRAATDSGVFVEVRASDAADAPVVERWRLYGASYALVIGNDNYTNGWPRLSNAVKDAEEVANEMRRRGFEVELLTDVTGRQMEKALNRFFVIKGSNPDARLFVWYAGHGYTHEGEGYLVPTDAPAPQAQEFLLYALHMGNVGSMVRKARAKHVLAVFDSCFAGTIFNSQRARPPAAITAAVKKPVRQFLTSGDADQQVSDDGTFRTLFLRALRGEETADANRDGYLTGTELSLYLEDRVMNLTQGIQTPRGGKLRDPKFDQGDFVFLLPKAPAEQVAAAPAGGVTRGAAVPQATVITEPSRALLGLEFWKSIRDSERAADFEVYLRQYPDGAYTELARNRLRDIEAAPRVEEVEQQAALVVPAKPEPWITPLDATYVAVKNAYIRSEPSTGSAVTSRVARGASVNVTGRVRGKNWYRVALGSGGSAFIYASLIVEIDPRELVLWEQAAETGDPSDYQLYADRFPRGLFAAEARARAAPEPPERAFAPQGDGIAPAPGAPSRGDLDLTFWNSIKDSGRPADFEIYLKTFPDGSFTSLAALRLEGLKAEAAAGTAVAALPVARFDGKWKWKKVDLDGACSSARFRKIEIQGGKIKGSGRHPIGGFISVTGEVDEQGVATMRGSGGTFKLQFTGRFTETEGSGRVDMSGIADCSGTWRVTKRNVN